MELSISLRGKPIFFFFVMSMLSLSNLSSNNTVLSENGKFPQHELHHQHWTLSLVCQRVCILKWQWKNCFASRFFSHIWPCLNCCSNGFERKRKRKKITKKIRFECWRFQFVSSGASNRVWNLVQNAIRSQISWCLTIKYLNFPGFPWNSWRFFFRLAFEKQKCVLMQTIDDILIQWTPQPESKDKKKYNRFRSRSE